MSLLSEALNGDLDDVQAILNETMTPEIIAAAVMNLCRRIQNIERSIERQGNQISNLASITAEDM